MQRKIAFNILYKTINDASYTSLLMRKELDNLPLIQRGFVKNLVMGVLKNYDLLNFQHQALYQKCSIKNKLILSMACYEKFFLHEKEYVINNEYVELAESSFDKGFINAVLRKIDKLQYANDDSINESLPKWLYDLLKAQYNEDEFSLILKNYKRIPKTYYHLNHHKANYQNLLHLGIKEIDKDIFTSDKSLLNTQEFKDGLFYVQDINATTLIREFTFDENDTFLDACAAPGSKLFNALDYLKAENCYANDLNEKRVSLIKEKATILGFTGVHYLNEDASNLNNVLDIKFNKILLDVPCSGLGVIGRKPDIKFHIQPSSLDELQVIQKNILENCSQLLTNNGELVYSTCTLNKKENSKQVADFIKNHNDFELINEKTILDLDGDMFYVAKLKKV